MSIQKTYNVSKQKQLIDLNGNLVNFELEFIAHSKNGEPFEILVVDQAILDSQNTIPYKQAVDGKISGNIVADKNIYQNYFLIIRAENDCEVNVTINKKELPMVEQPQQYHPIYPPQQENYQPPQSMQPPQPMQSQPIQNNKKSSNLKFYLIIGFIVIGLGVAYYFFYYKKNKDKNKDKNNIINSQFKTSTPEVVKSSIPYQPSISKSPTPPVVKSPTPLVVKSPTPPVAVPYNTSLLDRLNSLKF